MQTGERRVVAALWSVSGVGPVTLRQVRDRAGPFGELLERPLAEWTHLIEWKGDALPSLAGVECLAQVADRLEQQLARLGYEVAFEGDPAWPPRLLKVDTVTPVLFVLGPGARAAPRRRAAMVGTRHPDTGFQAEARKFARGLAAHGVGIVSGAAVGIDQACHLGALDLGAETWAFLGCAIDQMDDAQRRLYRPFRDLGGTFFSQYPPGTRSERSTFPRRNRLIAGAADAVVVLRAGGRSGALHTVKYAREQGRPVLAMPGDFFNPAAEGCNELLRKGAARVCVSPADVLDAVGLADRLSSPDWKAAPTGALSQNASAVLAVLSRTPSDFDEVLSRCQRLGSGAVGAALLELELGGFVVQKPGRRYEKVE